MGLMKIMSKIDRKKILFLIPVILLVIVVFILIRLYYTGFYKWIGDYKYYINLKEKTAGIYGYRGDGNITFPEEIYGCEIIHIENDIFYENDNVKSVYIQNYPQIKYKVNFKGCENLEEVIFDESIKYASYNFAGCSNLKSVILPDNIEQIDSFFSETSIEEINIPKTVEYIAPFAFSDTPYKEQHTKDKYYVVGDGVLLFYNGPEDEIIIPDGVKNVDLGIIVNDDNTEKAVKTIYFPESYKRGCIIFPEEATAFFGSEEIDVNEYNPREMRGTIVAPAGSFMEEYCAENNLNFRVMTEEEEAIWREKTEAAASEIVYQE